MSAGEVRKVSPQEIQLVQNLIEECLHSYMSPKEIISVLYDQEKIEPSFTELVWQKLEEQNQDFFKGYHLRLMVKEQILEFNKLLDKQVQLMRQPSPTGVSFSHISNGSQIPPIHQNSMCFAPGSTAGLLLKTENMQCHVPTNLPSSYTDCGTSMHSSMPHGVDMPSHTRTFDVSPDMILAHNSNVGMMPGLSRVPLKTETRYLGNSRFIYGVDGNALEARAAIGDPSVSSFSSVESNSQPLNETLLEDTSSFGLLGQMSRNFSLSDLTADFSNNSDILESYSRSTFLPMNRGNFFNSQGNKVDLQGENRRLETISERLRYGDFGTK